MAVISKEAGSLLKLFVDDFAIIPDCILPHPSEIVFGSVLAPWPNRLEDGSYSHLGQTYSFDILDEEGNKNHGLLLEKSFDVLEQEPHRVLLGYQFRESQGYPFEIDLKLEYELLADGLRVIATATNLGEQAPFAIGFHPYFLTGEEFSLSAKFTHQGISNERKLPVAIDPIPGLEINQDSDQLSTLDHCFMGSNEVVLKRPAGAFVVRALENLPYFMLYRPKQRLFSDGSAIAIEPMSAPANVFRNDPESVMLQRGQTKVFAFEVKKL